MAESKLTESISVSHMRALDRASARVNSWPQWKRETIQYRDNESRKSEVPEFKGRAPMQQA